MTSPRLTAAANSTRTEAEVRAARGKQFNRMSDKELKALPTQELQAALTCADHYTRITADREIYRRTKAGAK